MSTIIQKPIGRNCGFVNQLYRPTWFVVHFTGGTPNLQSLYNYWLSQCGTGSNSHYGIERTDNQYAKAGDIWQFVPLTDGSCANCCLENGAAPFLPRNVNMNVRTISVECINPNTSNDGAIPQKQMDSLVYLISTVCKQMNIPTNIITQYWNGYENTTTWGNQNGGVIMHRDIAPVNRRRCPGEPYYNGQMQQVMNLVNGGSNMSVFIPPDKNRFIIETWEAFSRATKTPLFPRDRGIFTFWSDLITKRNICMGSPLTDEIIYDANWIVEYFEGGSIWWNRTRVEVHAITGSGPF